MHVKFEVHMHDKIASHGTRNKMYGQVHTCDENV